MESPVAHLPICYLCGLSVEKSQRSRDHVVPRTLLDHRSPKVRGFDYAGKLVTHAKCNNRFGGEIYVQKAIDLLGALYDPDTTLKRRVGDDRPIQSLMLNSSKLTGFTEKDLQFFGIHDARLDDVASFSHREYFENKRPVNPFKRALFPTLSVLGKSAAALLVSRKLKSLPKSWNIIAFPYAGNFSQHDLTKVFGNTKPFGTDVKIWINKFEFESWVVLYVTKTTMVWFFFVMSDRFPEVKTLRRKLLGAPQGFQFQGNCLMELVDYKWIVREDD